VGADGRSDPISIGGEDSGAHLALLALGCCSQSRRPQINRFACHLTSCSISLQVNRPQQSKDAVVAATMQYCWWIARPHRPDVAHL